MLVLKRIHCRYELQAAPDADRARIERAFDLHMGKCPIYRSLERAIDMTTSLHITEGTRATAKESRR